MTRRLKVVHLGKYYPPVRGGMESALETLCSELKHHVDLNVLVSSETAYDCEESIDGVSVRRLARHFKIGASPICLGLGRALMQSEADIVHIHLPNPVALLTHHYCSLKSDLICTYHSDIIRQKVVSSLIHPLHERALSKSSAIICTSPNLIESSAVLRRHRSKCHIIPFGIKVPDEEAAKASEYYKYTPFVLAVGRLVYYKGFDLLIRAFAKVSKVANLVIVGDGPLKGALQQLIEDLGLTKRVFLIGNIADISPIYGACDLFVLPSIANNEAFGLVQLEAMAFGKPVINTNLPTGVPYVSRHEETGLTVPVNDESAMTQALERLLSDSELRSKLGKAARQRAKAHFSLTAMIKKTLDVYGKVAGF
jgi:rhamnosyl/mannosyltransferase